MTAGSAAVVGVGLAGIGEAPGSSHLDLIGLAVVDAVADAGLVLTDVDALYTANMADLMPALSVGEYLGLTPSLVETTNTGGDTIVRFVHRAALALEAGLCEVALVCYGSVQRTGGGSLLPPDPVPWQPRFSPREPITSYALAAARYLHETGTTREQLASVAVAARRWSAAHPQAVAREPLTVADVLASRMISDPITVLDCCLSTDGAGAIVLTRTDRARDLPRPLVAVLAGASARTHRAISRMPDLTRTPAAVTGPAVFAATGLSPADIDLAQVYDAFTVTVPMFLEDLGFCRRGEAAAIVADGGTSPGGALPVNTNGGGLAFAHPGMFGVFQVIEAVEQLRGAARGLQVPDPRVALVHGNGGVLSSGSTLLLGTEAML